MYEIGQYVIAGGLFLIALALYGLTTVIEETREDVKAEMQRIMRIVKQEIDNSKAEVRRFISRYKDVDN